MSRYTELQVVAEHIETPEAAEPFEFAQVHAALHTGCPQAAFQAVAAKIEPTKVRSHGAHWHDLGHGLQAYRLCSDPGQVRGLVLCPQFRPGAADPADQLDDRPFGETGGLLPQIEGMRGAEFGIAVGARQKTAPKSALATFARCWWRDAGASIRRSITDHALFQPVAGCALAGRGAAVPAGAGAGAAGTRLHAAAEAGVPMRSIAEIIAGGLGIPARSLSDEEASAHFGWMAFFVGMGQPHLQRLHPRDAEVGADGAGVAGGPEGRRLLRLTAIRRNQCAA